MVVARQRAHPSFRRRWCVSQGRTAAVPVPHTAPGLPPLRHPPSPPMPLPPFVPLPVIAPSMGMRPSVTTHTVAVCTVSVRLTSHSSAPYPISSGRRKESIDFLRQIQPSSTTRSSFLISRAADRRECTPCTRRSLSLLTTRCFCAHNLQARYRRGTSRIALYRDRCALKGAHARPPVSPAPRSPSFHRVVRYHPLHRHPRRRHMCHRHPLHRHPRHRHPLHRHSLLRMLRGQTCRSGKLSRTCRSWAIWREISSRQRGLSGMVWIPSSSSKRV